MKQIKGRALILHGADDRFVTQDQVAAFETEMRSVGINYRLIQYPGAVHSFTVKEAGDDPSAGTAYNAAADTQSWEEMTQFLAEVLEDFLK